VSLSSEVSPASRRSITCPRPNGTGSGYNKASGHNASSTRLPWASGTNQSARNWLQRCSAPSRTSTQADAAPSQAPALLSPKSTLDGMRIGKWFCNVSTPSDNNTGRASATGQVQTVQPDRSRASASKKPSGAYPIRLATTSKPVQYWGSGANKKSVGATPCSRHPVKGYRLA